MKLTHYIYICTALALLTSCGDDVDPVYTVGEADNAIVLQAGVVDGGKSVQTRATWDTGDRHDGKHLALATNIKLKLKVEGKWTGHNVNGVEASAVSKETTATVGAETSQGSKHNTLSFSPQLYWDDYGTADPNNENTGRTNGLTIFGVAVNDASVATPPAPTNGQDGKWQPLAWDVVTTTTTEGIVDQNASNWSTKDLIISNNVQPVSAGKYDGALKFDDWKKKDGSANDLLEFKHAMSKITINLKANKGFPTSGTNLVGNTTNKFAHNPAVYLLTKDGSNAEIAYAFTKGNVNIQNGELSSASEPKIINMKLDKIPTSWEDGEFVYTVQMTALVVPGTVFGANPDKENSSDEFTAAQQKVIAKIVADENVYYVSAQEISKKLKELNSSTDFKTEPGKNYILNINVEKTEVHVNATVADWIDVTAAEATPKIDINTSYGTDGTAFPKESLSFYYSKDKFASSDKYGIETSGFYASDATGTKADGKITLSPEIYWPTHNTKYFFRGVWPLTSVTDSEILKTDTSKEKTDTKPSVTLFTDANSSQQEGIFVRDMAYKEGTFPSDLMLGIPHVENPTTGGPLDEGDGISATEGTITLNFTYRMAQVVVQLKSSGWDNTQSTAVLKTNNIDFGSKGTGGANQAKVEIVNGYDQGYILLADGSASLTQKGDYVMTPLSTSLPDAVPNYADASFSYATDENKFLVRHDAVIPQSLGTTDTDALKFKITTGSLDNESDQDIYYISIKDIQVQENGGSAKYITAWEAGKKYTYTLYITKTEVKIKATITPWIDVVAGGDFWL